MRPGVVQVIWLHLRAVVTICTTHVTIKLRYIFPHTLYLYVLCGSQNKQRLFPYTALGRW